MSAPDFDFEEYLRSVNARASFAGQLAALPEAEEDRDPIQQGLWDAWHKVIAYHDKIIQAGDKHIDPNNLGTRQRIRKEQAAGEEAARAANSQANFRGHC